MSAELQRSTTTSYLRYLNLGHEIHLWHVASGKTREKFNQWIAGEPEVWHQVKAKCASVSIHTMSASETLLGRLLARLRAMFPPRLPVSRWSVHRELTQVLTHVRPDFVWAQHTEAALWAAQQSVVPVVHVHHDWLYRIKALRNRRDINLRQQATEERLVRSVAAVVSGSHTECEEIRQVGGRHVAYVPVSFDIAPLNSGTVPPSPPRLVHLGGMGTTANREGLLAFFEQCVAGAQGHWR